MVFPQQSRRRRCSSSCARSMPRVPTWCGRTTSSSGWLTRAMKSSTSAAAAIPNSKRLVEVVRNLGGKPAYLVDRVEDLDSAWFNGVNRVGVTSGASTPTQLTRQVVEYLQALEVPVS